MQIKRVSSYEELLELKDSWNSLLQKSEGNTVFNTWEWLSTWWKYFGVERELLVLLAIEDDEIVGIAPLMRSTVGHIIKIDEIEFIGTPHSDYHDFILLKKKQACMRIFLANILSMKRSWVDLQDIPADSSSVEIIKGISTLPYSLRIVKQNVCPCVSLPASFDNFLQSLKGNWRRKLRKWLRKLQEKHHVEFYPYFELYSPKEGMKTFYELHQKRWEALGKPGSFKSKIARKFHEEIAEKFSKNEWLGLYFLLADKKPVAAAYGFEHEMKMYLYLTGFDPDYANFAVGHLLDMYLIKHCIKKGYKELDFLRGAEKYKDFWGAKPRQNLNIRASRTTSLLGVYKLAQVANRLRFPRKSKE